MDTIELTIPAFCAPYLINGDDSDGRAIYEADRICAHFKCRPGCLSLNGTTNESSASCVLEGLC